jgi:hypothetical protein
MKVLIYALARALFSKVCEVEGAEPSSTSAEVEIFLGVFFL